ncbi:ATP-binding protein [Salmonella enterica subsp. enterica]|uniref:ATP-binding protein n=1 Tax=Salmonella enterica I TaxID=59201 RepID=A0A6Y3E8M4_SALET|nr:ATP-binding protein [Salmonella enterica subsp. enterica]EDQ9964183.1 ATP-binding protein [Salmonella enterica subsp. enterica serovar Java]ECD2885956.1 ATP-binding protein [Salmonella enterica subsp. enterica]ECD4081749.1 ATP-binding protein [Salmonella enterica subsp. enterica]ECD6587926.1 ATP-binding protein [Salmonella enterica subsp. enterica]
MTKHNKNLLSEQVRIARQYQRSIRIDADLGREDALDGYVCNGTAQSVLENMSKQVLNSQQRAFTWTGPYGSGKSSLALVLASSLSPNKALREKARSLLNVDSQSDFDKAFQVKKGWLILPVIGRRGSIIQQISQTLNNVCGSDKDYKKSASLLIKHICSAADEAKLDGTLLIIDELGKFLEASALGNGDDIYFYQELAESAARTNGKVIILGILHQSFGQYAVRLGLETREEWTKIQGRYADIPLVAGSDEVVELIGKALDVKKRPEYTQKVAQVVADAIYDRRPMVGKQYDYALSKCWPLHPVMAALLGPISKRQFGQNERSTFGFLSSSEPFGFQNYLNLTTFEEATWYLPSNYFDYLRANLEQLILASNDGHRWAQAVDAVERAEAKSDNILHIDLIKCIVILDLFKDGSGLTAETSILESLFLNTSIENIRSALEDLSKWRVIIFKKHTGAWSVFEGSDFNIDQAVAQSRATMLGTDFSQLNKIANLYPVIAKRHYHQTGTFRWMNIALCHLNEVKKYSEEFQPRNGEFGLFLLALPERNVNEEQAKIICADASRSKPWPIVAGIPHNYLRIEDLGAELLALQIVQTKRGHELQGDAVARREVQARISATQATLEEQLAEALATAEWCIDTAQAEPKGTLSSIASSLADNIYYKAPRLWSELVNRDNLSSNSVKARKELLYRMLENEGELHLGIEGYPASRGLYETILHRTGLYAKHHDGYYHFLPAVSDKHSSFYGLWKKTHDFIKNKNQMISVSDIHTLWAKPPFGLKKGVIPIIFMAFLLASKSNIAIYKDGLFIPTFTDADIDEYLQDEKRFSLRWIVIDDEKQKILVGIGKLLDSIGLMSNSAEPLEAARSLVAMIVGLPNWTQRTARLSSNAKKVRDTLLKASDPHKVLFIDLAAALNVESGKNYVDALQAPVKELWSAYDKLLDQFASRMLKALNANKDDLSTLRKRAETLSGITGELRQDAFSTRLATYDGSHYSIEGILSLAANKPPRDWNDRDIDLALMEIANFALRFRQSEALVSIQGRKPSSEAFAVVIGAGSEMKTFKHEFSIPAQFNHQIDNLAGELIRTLSGKGLNPDIIMAALGKACIKIAQHDVEVKND